MGCWKRLTAAAVLSVSTLTCSTHDVYLVQLGESADASVRDSGSPKDSGVIFRDVARGDGASGCAVDHYVPTPSPLGIYILVNQASSMASLWAPVEQALIDFIVDSGKEPNINAGIQYFPNLDSFLTVCDPPTYATLDVPIALLPGNELALITSLGRHGPDALLQAYGAIAAAQLFLVDSPATSALTGAIQAARTWQTAQTTPGARGIVLFVTNAVPSTSTSPTCMATLDATVAAAAAGVAGTPSISTYVLGVGDLLTDLDTIAAAGGTGAAHIVRSSVAADIVQELVGLRSYALSCQFTVDVSWLTQGLVNVDAKETQATLQLSRVLGPENCTSTTTASWYAADPNQIVLCPAACDAVRTNGALALDVVYGCPTIEAR